jgi:TRAP-type uncharacterized transport system fused permease subunit
MIMVTALMALVGVYTVTAGIVGFLGKDLSAYERAFLIICGLTILSPWDVVPLGVGLNAAGVILVGLFWMTRLRRRV